MSVDTSKAEKLAAARRKLKEFQNQQKIKEIESTPRLPVETNKENVNQYSPASSQTQELPCTYFTLDATHSEAPVVKNDAQLPNLSHYFSETNKSNFFFDVVPKCDPLVNKTNDTPELTVFNSPSIFTPVVTAPSEEVPTSINIMNSSSSSVSMEGAEKRSDSRNDETLMKELILAEAKIKMQAEALDIITAEREDVQLKLQNALKVIEAFRENETVFENRLRESREEKEELNRLTHELRCSNEASSKATQILEQKISDLKEKNEELEQVLKMQVERNAVIQKQLDETQSSQDMLILKFKQLGIETAHDNPDYKAICEESNSIKRKYAELEEQLKTLAFEKEHTDNEYRQYIQNLQTELHQTKAELQEVSVENQVLVDKISSQTNHISSLEKMLQKPQTAEYGAELVSDLQNQIQNLKEEIEKEREQSEAALSQVSDYEEWKHKAISLAESLESLKLEMVNTDELQMAIESNRVAASQAVSQNNKLKSELERLNDLIHTLNNEKQVMQVNLEKSDREKEMLLINLEEVKAQRDKLGELQNHQHAEIISPTTLTRNDAAINTDAQISSDENDGGKTNLMAMQQLQEKFKSVLDRMADLTDEKQQLEHLVMQLQSETETIEEYVALYQMQRSILQQRARETDLKMEQVAVEKQRLLKVIRSILTADISDSHFIKELIQQNLSAELTNELNLQNGALNNDSFPSDSIFNNETVGHHPSCHCCSGKLITV